MAGKNMLAYGELPAYANDFSNDSLMLSGGAIINGDLSTVYDVDVRNPEEIQEFVTHSWYDYPGNSDGGLHPWDGVTEPRFELGPNAKGTERISRPWTKGPSIPGSRRRAGAGTRWKSARCHASWWPTPGAGRT